MKSKDEANLAEGRAKRQRDIESPSAMACLNPGSNNAL